MKKMSVILVILVILLAPASSFAQEIDNTTVLDNIQFIERMNNLEFYEDEILTEEDLKLMVEKNDFLNYDVETETKKIDDEFILVTKTIKQEIKPINDDLVLLSNDPAVTRVIHHRMAELRKSNYDSARTATVYLTLVFDEWTVDNIQYARLDEYRYSVFMHDSSFRPKIVEGLVGQSGMGALDMNGNRVAVASQRKPISRTYPTPSVSYKAYTGFNQYINTQGNNDIGGWINVVLERKSTGGSLTNIRVSGSY